MTQTQLAAASGIDQPNISAIESDRREPTASTLHRLLLACGYDLLAVAGERVIPLPADPDDEALRAISVEPLSDTERHAALLGVLAASEAVVRGKRRG